MWIVLVILAAFGLLCALWVCLGFLLPGQKGVVMVYRCRGESVDALVRRYRWLRDVGLIRCPLIIIDDGMSDKQRKLLENRPGVRVCDVAELTAQEK